MAKFKLSSSQLFGGIVAPLLIVALLGVGYFMIYPQYKNLLDRARSMDAKAAELNVRQSQLSGVKTLAAEAEAKKASLDVLNQAIPEAPRIPELLANFDQLTQQSGMFLANVQITPAQTIATLAPGQSVSQATRLEKLLGQTKKLGVIEVNLTLRGSYPNFKNFLGVAEQNLRLFDIQGMNSVVSAGDPTAREFTITLDTYYQKP